MKCPKCNGNKEIHTPIYTQGNPFMPSGWEYRTCEYCNGTGEVEQTNEEWFDSLTTEKKAKIIKMVINICISCKEHGAVRTKGCHLRQKMAKNLLFLPCMDEDGICKWLKQPHT